MANSTTIYQNNQGVNSIDVDNTSKVLTLADCGIIQNVIVDGLTVTLPATAAGSTFTVRNGGLPASTALGSQSGADAGVLVNVAPNSADKIQGLGFTAADNKSVLNTKATSRVGDYIRLVGDGIDGYNVIEARGIWARAA